MVLRVATWNLNHRAVPRQIPEWVSDELVRCSADVVVVTEYVPGRDEPPLPSRLLSRGAAAVSVSNDRGARDNRILIATKEQHRPGPIAQPEIDLVSAHANFLSVTLESGTIVVGFRMPAYTAATPGGFEHLWDWIFAALAPYKGKNLVLAGDLNADFVRLRDRRLRLSERLEEVGLSRVPVAGGVSFRSSQGADAGTRIDHVFVGGELRGEAGHFDWSAIDREHPGCAKCSHGLPDHALLTAIVR